MGRHLLSLLLGIAALSAGVARAQETEAHPRRARALHLLSDEVVVLIDDDRAWSDPTVDPPVSVCADEVCARVVEVQTCEAPECPGPGRLLVLERGVRSVSAFPTGVEEFQEEIASMSADPVLSALATRFSQHPDYDPNAGSDAAHGWSLHFGFAVEAATRGDGGGLLFGGAGEIGLRLGMDPDDGMFESFIGDRATLVVRGGYLLPTLPQRSEGLGFVGASLELENRIADSSFQVPSALSLVLPELGVLLRAEDGPSFYARFSLPVKIVVGDALGVEARFEWTLAERANGDGVESIIGVSIGGFVQ